MCSCSHDSEYPDDNWNLYQHIETAEALNTEGDPSRAKLVFKPHSRRLEIEPELVSADDEEIIVKIWFSTVVSVRKICVANIGSDGDEHPSEVRCFPGKTAESLGFDSIEDAQPAQVIPTPVDPAADAHTLCTLRPFSRIQFLLLHFPGNHGDGERTRVSYIGLQGEHSHAKRQAVHARYELIPNPNAKTTADLLGKGTLQCSSKPGL